MTRWITPLLAGLLLSACGAQDTDQPTGIAAYTDSLLAEGFALPVGDGKGGGSYTGPDGRTHTGWYIATTFCEVYDLGIHPGEDWNGKGGGNTDYGQPVYATARGVVEDAQDYGGPWAGCIRLRHHYIENGHVRVVYSTYAHLSRILVKVGDTVKLRQQIGSIGRDEAQSYPAHLHFELRSSQLATTYWPSSEGKDVAWVRQHYLSPSEFVLAHRKCPRPKDIARLAVVIKEEYTMYLLEHGRIVHTLPVALSQRPEGHKLAEGDLKLPEGAYYICEKSVGPFYQEGGDPIKRYLGNYWMRISYPNTADAKAGLKRGALSQQQYEAVRQANLEKKMPPKNTGLGGGIGIHGWLPDGWDPDDDRDLTWGCISMNAAELKTTYHWLPSGAPIWISPK